MFDFLFTHNKNIDPSRPALIDAATGVEMSYAALREESLRFSDGLRRVAGLTPSDTILIFWCVRLQSLVTGTGLER